MKTVKKIFSLGIIALALVFNFSTVTSAAENHNLNDGIMLLEDLEPDTNMRQ